MGAFRPDGKVLALADWNRVEFLEPKQGLFYRPRPEVDVGLLQVVFAPDGQALALTGGGGMFGTLCLYRLDTGVMRKLSSKDHQDKVYAAFSPDSRWLAAGSGDWLFLYDAQSGKELLRQKARTLSVSSIAFSPGGKLLAAGGMYPQVRFWAVADLFDKERAALEKDCRQVADVELRAGCGRWRCRSGRTRAAGR